MRQMSVRRDYGIGVISAPRASAASSAQLRRWLAGRWALLFSHPDDFASGGFEADRWQVYVRSAFDILRVRAIAIGHDQGSGWIPQIGGRFISGREADDLVPQLRNWTSLNVGKSAAEHFVTILDGSARARRTFLYESGGHVPSVIALVQTASHLRERAVVPTSARRILHSV